MIMYLAVAIALGAGLLALGAPPSNAVLTALSWPLLLIFGLIVGSIMVIELVDRRYPIL